MENNNSEQRFRKIMDKLYYFPKPVSKPASLPPSGASLLKKEKRITDLRCGMGMNGLSDSQPCKPWDRGDLTRRLLTFKATTWFGKPKSISPIACARRGWVNVDVDTIACEACGSRLLFSSPSSWAFRQVEKAAAVFSLKLDSGHKLPCPWTDNICDEYLTRFPPTPNEILVKGYTERASTLLQLLTLPVISSSAIDYMKSTQLENLLKKSFSIPSLSDDYIQVDVNSNSEKMNFDSEASYANLYFQAQKLISLCGWEPRFLPYTVDCVDKSMKNSTSKYLIGVKRHPTLISSTEIEEEKYNQESERNQSYSASSVLDCKLCGACVGLWAFKSILRPLEHFELSDFPENNNENENENENPSCIQANGSSNLKLTIAGGLPPAKQNFRTRVSLPIISRHLRAEMSSEYTQRSRDDLQSDKFSQHTAVNPNSETVISLPNVETLKRKRTDDECSNHEGLKNSKMVLYRDGGGDGMSNANSNLTSNTDCPSTSGVAIHEKILANETVNHNKNTDNVVDANQTDLKKGDESLDSQNLLRTKGLEDDIGGLNETLADSSPVPLEMTGKKFMPMRWENTEEEFDPIRHHRPFCPWITPEDGIDSSKSGWKLTLSALDTLRETSSSSLIKEAQSSRLSSMMDDPISSIRSIFNSRPSKR